MTGNPLDEILSDAQSGDAAPAPDIAAEPSGQARDEQGRFAATTPAQPEPNSAPVAADPVEDPATGTVPLAALHASREKAKAVEQENGTLRATLSRLEGQIEVLTRQVQQPRPATPTEPEKKADYWEDPEGFVSSQLSPVQVQLRKQTETMSLRFAVKEHGKEAVEAAYQALGQAVQAGDPVARQELERFKASDDPFEEIMTWHKRQSTLQTVGADPEAWFNTKLEAMIADPAFQAKVIERARGSSQQTPGQRPLTELPPTLSRIPGNGSMPSGGTSDAELFSHATR